LHGLQRYAEASIVYEKALLLDPENELLEDSLVETKNKMRKRKTNEPRIEEVSLIHCSHGEFEFFSCEECLEVARYRQLAVALGIFTKTQEKGQTEIKWNDPNEPPHEHVDKFKMLEKEKLFEYYWNAMKNAEENNDPKLLEFTRVAYEPEKFWNTILEFGSIANALNASLYEFYERDKQLILENIVDQPDTDPEKEEEEEKEFISGADYYNYNEEDENEENDEDDDDLYYDEEDEDLYGEEEIGEGDIDEYLLSMLAAAARGGAGRHGHVFNMNAEEDEGEDGEEYEDVDDDDDEENVGDDNQDDQKPSRYTEYD